MVINSVSNNKVQFLRRLSMRKYREQEGLFVIEGENIIKDLPQSAKVHSMYVAESKKEVFSYYAEKHNCQPFILSDRVFNSVSDTVNPAGILAVIPYEKYSDLKLLGERAIVLDNISDPGNLGTIIRTATAFGYQDIVLISGADPYSGKSVRSSMGGIFRVKIFEADYDDINYLAHKTYILDMKGEDIETVSIDKNYILVVGSEAHGVSDYFRERAQASLSIKMTGDIESLNAAVSAAIAMYVVSNKKN